MVVFSHGAYGIRFQSIFFTQYLASHGYVVPAPDHQDNTLYDLFAEDGYNIDDMGWSAVERPYDAAAVIDRMLERNATPGDTFAGSVDPDRIGMSGHSFGG